jgi:hypothetical protein
MLEENQDINPEIIRKYDTGKAFDTPVGYFERLEAELLSKTAGNGFAVPDDYFNNLEGRIKSRMANQKAQFALLYGGKKWIALAAASLLAVGMLVFLLRKPDPQYVSQLNALSDEEIIYYVGFEDLNDAHLLELAFNGNEKQNDQTEQYLLNTADADLILEEL